MIHKPLEQITKADLEGLLADKRSESRTLDYKRDLPLAKDEDRRELAKDVASFANAAGGDLIYGVEEARDANGRGLGVPEKLLGIDSANFDDTKLRYENVVRDVLDPRVQGIAFHRVGGFERGPVVIVRVPKSWIGPHMVSFQSQTHFYSRNNSGRHPLDVREIRASFIAGTEAAARVQRFREQRIGQIVAGETPLPLRNNKDACVVVHVVPVGDLDATRLDLIALKDGTVLRPPSPGNGWNHRFNLDGFVVYGGPTTGPQHSYSQAFRDGAFEGVDVGYLHGNKDGPPQLSALPLEATVVATVETFFKALRANNFDGPASVMLTVLGVRGARIYIGQSEWTPREEHVTIDRDILVLPDVFVERLDADPRVFLRSTFDALWQSSGFAASRSYDTEGKWKERR